MKLGITFKLFLAVLLTGILVTLAMGAATRWAFERQFLEYVKEREERRVSQLLVTLSDVYRRDGDWSRLQNNSAAWTSLLMAPPPREDMMPPPGMFDPELFWPRERGSTRRYSLFERIFASPLRGRDAPPDPTVGEPGIGVSPAEQYLPGVGAAPGNASDPASHAGSSGYAMAEPNRPPLESTYPRMPPPDFGGLPPSPGGPFPIPPFSLLAADGSWVAGMIRTSSTETRHPISFAGKTVGYLVIRLPNRLPDEADRRFQAEQRDTNWVIAGFCVLLAALVSVCLARVVVAPLRRLGRATRLLATGEYATRVTISSSDELGRLGTDFNRLAHTLERNEALRREMVADISHELRTPLAVMQGELEALQDGIRPLTPEAISSLQGEVVTLSKMVGDLYDLALADIGALSYRMDAVDMSQVVVNAADLFRERLASRSIALQLSIPAALPTIEGDEGRLGQLLNNLLENAVRYTDPGGQVQIALKVEGEQLLMTFDDSSPGVPQESLPRLFDRLYRVEGSRSRESGGAGLGLAICHRIVAAHQGSIEASASLLGGLHMRIALPLSTAYVRA